LSVICFRLAFDFGSIIERPALISPRQEFLLVDTPQARSKTASATPRVVVAIPVRNERDRIEGCLSALASQVGLDPGSLGIVLFANNCTDDTCDVVRALPSLPWPLRLIERTDPAASAGWARRIAMDAAAEWLVEGGHADGILLTTDADSRVGKDWVARNLACIAKGADAVAGRISLEPHEAALLPRRLHARGRLEAEYEAILTEIGARLDAEPGNPWPCHWTKSGATLAVRLTAYRAVGGMPDQPAGEDRAFIDAIRAHDLVVRHDPTIEVVTSGRLEGRAIGGVADTIRLRCEVPDSHCDLRLERVLNFVNRCFWRRTLRRLHASGSLKATWRWAPFLAIGRQTALSIANSPFAGQTLAAIEIASPRLAYRPVRPSALLRQIGIGRLFLRALRAVEKVDGDGQQICRVQRRVRQVG
jgi:glycosyltransferase involved in cell wall biosynthesis